MQGDTPIHKRSKKLILVSPMPPPVGGIATWTKNLLNFFSETHSGWEIIHLDSAIKHRSIVSSSIWLRIYGGIRDFFRIYHSFWRKLKIIQPDLVHLTSSASLSLFKDYMLLKLARINRIPVVIHFRFGRIPELGKLRNWEWKLLCFVVERCKYVIVLDNKSFECLNNNGYNNVVKIPNPISYSLEKKIKEIECVQKQPGKIVFVGHVVFNKGVYELVSSCLKVPKVSELRIIGPFDEKIKKELISIAFARDRGNWLKFTGTLLNVEILTELNSASIFILPSHTEGFPNVLIEAMAMRCPVIASNVGAIPEILDVETKFPCGICITPGNINEISGAIKTLLDNPDQLNNFGNNGYNKVLGSYSMTQISESYLKLWDSISMV